MDLEITTMEHHVSELLLEAYRTAARIPILGSSWYVVEYVAQAIHDPVEYTFVMRCND